MSKERSKNFSVMFAIGLVVVGMVLFMELLTQRLDTKLRGSPRHVAEMQVLQLVYAVEGFHQDTKRYPRPGEGLSALLRAPQDLTESWKGPYLHNPQLPLDPWDNAYQYRLRAPDLVARDGGKAFEIFSLGEDGQPGGEADGADISSGQFNALFESQQVGESSGPALDDSRQSASSGG